MRRGAGAVHRGAPSVGACQCHLSEQQQAPCAARDEPGFHKAGRETAEVRSERHERLNPASDLENA